MDKYSKEELEKLQTNAKLIADAGGKCTGVLCSDCPLNEREAFIKCLGASSPYNVASAKQFLAMFPIKEVSDEYN